MFQPSFVCQTRPPPPRQKTTNATPQIRDFLHNHSKRSTSRESETAMHPLFFTHQERFKNAQVHVHSLHRGDPQACSCQRNENTKGVAWLPTRPAQPDGASKWSIGGDTETTQDASWRRKTGILASRPEDNAGQTPHQTAALSSYLLGWHRQLTVSPETGSESFWRGSFGLCCGELETALQKTRTALRHLLRICR